MTSLSTTVLPTAQCYGHGWYLACDMQFYIVAPIFIYVLYKYEAAVQQFVPLIEQPLQF